MKGGVIKNDGVSLSLFIICDSALSTVSVSAHVRSNNFNEIKMVSILCLCHLFNKHFCDFIIC